ncbi:MAG: LysE family translocator [Alphaproteobacteria bacterium]
MVEWHKLVEFFLIYGAAVISPGPNFVMVVRTSTHSTRKAGLAMTLGFGLGVLIQSLAAAFGIEVLFDSYPQMIKIIQYLGAIYLGYLGLVGLLAKPKAEPQEEVIKASSPDLLKSFKTGLLTHLSNPYAIIFSVSTFALFYDAHVVVRLMYVLITLILVVSWYGTAAVVLTHSRLQSNLYRFRHWIDRGAGIMLIYIAFKIGLADISMP